MSTFVPTPTASRWQELRQMPSRVPLRIKLIAALLALVVIALAVISMVGLAQFRSYLQDRADAQLSDLMSQALHTTPTVGGPPVPTFNFSGYVIVLRDLRGNLVPGCNQCTWQDLPGPGPSVPITQGWLSANAGKTVTVPALSGGDTWRVLVRRVGYRETSAFGQGPDQPGVLIVGADLGHLDQAVGWLAKVDLVISVIIVVALAIVGVAMVRASLRPLKDIENTAQAIAAGDLSRRVPDHDPRTEMGRLARSLNAMLAQIESAFRARAQSEAAARHSEERMRRFLADASHELRTPLTAIRGYAEYYRQRGGVENGSAPVTADAVPADPPAPAGAPAPADAVPADAAVPASRAAAEAAAMAGAAPGSLATATGDHGPLTRPEMNRIMERVEQESFRMGGLVEDMLVLARLDQQRPIERRPVDLLTLAADAVQDARIVAPSRSIDLTVGTGTAFLVLGDEGRLRQVISNLMTNALTHTPDGSPITVRILAGHQQGNPAVPCAIIEVADHGPGLTPEQASRVFERFYRADQARLRRTGGSGLGLAIVAALVAAHGGTAGVDTAPGQGATFRITLPLAPDALATEPVAE
ncbi:MAG TPA: HAMP domain-containing sensor histidine kinase [Streptosporangiaceae bacterium]|nr:HAMP domain-containing sensor histidine kinase [Streptosporangiaceae bacterium]